MNELVLWSVSAEIKRLEIKRDAILPLFPVNGPEINRLNILIEWLNDHPACTKAEFIYCESVAWRTDWDSELPDGMIRDFSGRIRPHPKSILEELLPNREAEPQDYETGPNGEPAFVDVLNSISLKPPPYFLSGDIPDFDQLTDEEKKQIEKQKI